MSAVEELLAGLKQAEEKIARINDDKYEKAEAARAAAFEALLTEISTAMSDIVSLMEAGAKASTPAEEVATAIAAAFSKIKMPGAPQITVNAPPAAQNHITVQPSETVVHVMPSEAKSGGVHRVAIEYGRGGLPVAMTITREA